MRGQRHNTKIVVLSVHSALAPWHSEPANRGPHAADGQYKAQSTRHPPRLAHVRTAQARPQRDLAPASHQRLRGVACSFPGMNAADPS